MATRPQQRRRGLRSPARGPGGSCPHLATRARLQPVGGSIERLVHREVVDRPGGHHRILPQRAQEREIGQAFRRAERRRVQRSTVLCALETADGTQVAAVFLARIPPVLILGVRRQVQFEPESVEQRAGRVEIERIFQRLAVGGDVGLGPGPAAARVQARAPPTTRCPPPGASRCGAPGRSCRRQRGASAAQPDCDDRRRWSCQPRRTRCTGSRPSPSHRTVRPTARRRAPRRVPAHWEAQSQDDGIRWWTTLRGPGVVGASMLGCSVPSRSWPMFWTRYAPSRAGHQARNVCRSAATRNSMGVPSGAVS